MTYKIERGQIHDAESIAQFQADTPMESKGLALNYEKALGGVRAAMDDEAKGDCVKKFKVKS
jgi:hypothetical protein